MLVARSSPNRLIQELLDLIGDPERVVYGEAAMLAYECDSFSVERQVPLAVVLPANTAEVQQVVRWCAERGVPVVPRGAGTSLSGGATPTKGSVVLSLKKMTRILEVDLANRCMLAEAGVVNIRLTQAVLSQGLHFAPDPSSQSVATLGGNIAENAGGAHCLKYGVTGQHVLGLKVVDARGELLELGGRLGRGPGLDWVAMVVGSEGTVGVVTEAWVRLTPLPQAVQTAQVAFRTVREATETVGEILAAGVIPAALEMMDRNVLVALKAAFGLSFPEGTDALLLIECDGDPQDVQREIEVIERVLARKNATEVKFARTAEDREALWTARKKGVGALGRIAPSHVTHDGVIPRSALPEVLEYCYQVAEEYGLHIANIFHAGDGNLHPIFCYDDRDAAQVRAVVAAGEKIVEMCVRVGGSVTGEHGVGVEKMALLKVMFAPADLQFQVDARSAFEPGGQMNPGKVLPISGSLKSAGAAW